MTVSMDRCAEDILGFSCGVCSPASCANIFILSLNDILSALPGVPFGGGPPRWALILSLGSLYTSCAPTTPGVDPVTKVAGFSGVLISGVRGCPEGKTSGGALVGVDGP